MTKKRVFERTLALLLCICMLISALPIQALATESDTGQSLTDNLSISSETSVTSRSVFDDVKPGDWFYKAVQYTYEKELFRGTDENHFSPNADMTRGMFVTVLGRAAGVSPGDYSGVTQFTDVRPGDYFAPFVEWAAKYGVTNGTSDSTFSPHKTVNRQEMVTFLAKYAEAFNVELKVENTVDTVPADLDRAAEWAKESVLLFWRTGILQGDGVNFNPTDNALRAQVATLFYNLDDKVAEWHSEPEQPEEPDAPDEPEKPGIPNWPNWPDTPDQPEEPELETYTVSFDLNGHGAAIASQTVTEGGKASEPTAPTAEGYTFGGWYTDAACTEVYDFNTKVTANITLYAKWTENVVEPEQPEQPEEPDTSYTVSFRVPSGVNAPDPETRAAGAVLGELPVPFYAGYIFSGWYYDEEYTKSVSESDTVSGNITLYGKYIQAADPVESNTPRVISEMDVDAGFTVTVRSSDTSLTATQVKALIAAKNANTDNNDVIQVEGSAGTYTITGTDGKNGFVEGNAYRIILEDDRLTFDECAETIREYSFTVKREEEVFDVALKDIVYIPQNEISNVVKNGAAQNSLDVSLFTLDDSIEDIHEIAEGTFTYTGGEVITVGTTVAVYDGIHPLARENSRSADRNGMISYVIITAVDGTTYSYKNAEMEDVLFTPDVLPVSANADTDGNADNNSITVPVSVLTYTDAQYEILGLDGNTLVEAGDYLAFYTGDFGTNDMALSFYAKIETVQRSESEYIITYSTVTEEEVLNTISIYQEDSVSGEAMLDGVDVEALEEQIRQQAIESGFVDEAVSYLTTMVLSTDAFTELKNEGYDLSSFTVTSNGAPFAAKAGGQDSRVEVSKVKVDPKITTKLKHYKDLSGLRAEVKVSFSITIDLSQDDNTNKKASKGEDEKKEKETLVIDVAAVFEQEVRVNLSVDGDIIWKWAWIFPYIDDIEASVSADLYTYTGIDIDATVTTKYDDGEEEENNISDKLKKLLNGDSEEEEAGSIAGGLVEAYQEMLENETDMIELVRVSLSRQRYNVALLFNVFINIDFVVSAEVNLSVGCEMYYENAKRYIYRIKIFAGKISNETVNLVTEHFVLEFYVLGTMHVRAGVQVEIGLSLLTGGVASVSVIVDVGAYAEFRGFFYYRLEYYAGGKATNFAQGGMYFELGVYLTIDLNMQVGGGKKSFNPTLVDEQFPLWSIGENEVLVDFAVDPDEVEEIRLKHKNTSTEIPIELLKMTYLNLTTGKDYTEQYEVENLSRYFTVTFDNPAFSLSRNGKDIQVKPGDAVEQDTVMTITWQGSPYLFSSEPMHRTVKIHWDKIREGGYVISFNTKGGSTIPILTVAYGAAFELPADPTKQGYIFDGWYTDEKLTSRYTKPDTMPAEDVTLYAKWTPRSDMPYTVEHHWERVDGSGFDVYETETFVGVTNTRVTPAVKQYVGFASPKEVDMMIKADGSSKKVYYYTRLAYTLTFRSGYEGGDTITQEYKYGQTITPVFMSRLGYVFNGWDIEIPDTMPANNLTVTARWTEATDTRYSVRHHVKNQKGIYALVRTTPGYGTTNSAVTMADHIQNDLLVDGDLVFDYAKVYGKVATTATIKADGSMVFDLYYSSQLHTLSWEFNGGTATDTSYTQGSLVRGSSITVPTVVKDGYDFGGWFTDAALTIPYNGETMPAEDLTLYAKWFSCTDTRYRVEHYVEDVTGTPVLVKTETGAGTTDATVYTDTWVAEELLVENGIVFDHAAVGDEIVTETTISHDGSLVIKMYYSRQSHTLNWVFNGGVSVTASYTQGSVPYGSSITVPTVVKTGYEFGGWFTDAALTTRYSGETMPTEDLTLYAKWTVRNDIQYRVEHYVENVNGTAVLVKTDTYEGITNATLYINDLVGSDILVENGIVFDYAIVDGNTVTETVIPSDGSLIVKLYYARCSNTLSWNFGGGTVEGTFSYTVAGVYPYGSSISVPNLVRVGYEFGGWFTDAAYTTPYDGNGMPAGNVTLYAKWIARSDIQYRVEHYVEDMTGTAVLVKTDTCEGTTGDTLYINDLVAADLLVENGIVFNYASVGDNAVTEIMVSSDGSLVVKLYYDRLSYTLNWNFGEGTVQDTSSYTEAGARPYGSSISVPNLVRVGYDFGGWFTDAAFTQSYNGETMPAKDLTLYAKWIARSDIQYRVEHYVEDMTGTAVLVKTDACEGITGATLYINNLIAADLLVENGIVFDYATVGDNTVTQIAVSGDGSLVVKLYYARLSYTLNWNFGEGTVADTSTYTEGGVRPYGSQIVTPELARQGYNFGGWFTDAAFTTPYDGNGMPAKNVTLYAGWTEADDTAYTVEYYLQNATDDVYVINPDATLRLVGTTNSRVTAPEKTFEHFTLNLGAEGTVASGIVTADGSLVLKLYYTRNSYTVTYLVDGVEYDSGTFRHGQQVTYPAAPEDKDGYTFGGWSWNGEVFNGVMPTENITLTAVWTTEDDYPYTVRYYQEGLNGGENILMESVSFTGTFGDTITVTPDRSFEGFDTPEAQELTISHGATVDFIYQRQSYTLVWDLNGGSSANSYTEGTVEYGAQITAPQNPTKRGYTFSGWSNEIPGTMPADDLSFSALWTADTYTITYQTNLGGNTNSNPTEYTIETGEITLADLSCDGYTFGGWFTNADCTGEPVTTIPANSIGNKVFYAKWTKITYTIYYTVTGNIGDTVVNNNRTTYDVESGEITLNDPIRAGYDFWGWYADPSLSVQVTTIPAGSIGDIYLFAKWAPTSYTITYHTSLGGDTNNNSEDYTIEWEEIILEDLSCEGYTFGGWYTNADCTGEPVTTIPTGSIGDKVFYAKWTKITYTITYVDAAHGENNVVNNNRTTYDVESGDLTLIAPTRTGYDFVGWYTDAGLTAQIETIPAGSTGNLTFYAKWMPTVYTITYNLNYLDTTNSVPTPAQDNPDSFTVESSSFTLQNPTRAGYTFKGWFTDPTGQQGKIESIAQGTCTEDLVLYAVWEVITYTITYPNASDGVNGVVNSNPTTYNVDSGEIVLVAPTLGGYNHSGWYTDAELTAQVTTIPAGSMGDLTFYTGYVLAVYTITYDLNYDSTTASIPIPAEGNPATYTIESETFALNSPTRAGYTFLGWSVQGTIIEGIVQGDYAEDLVLIAMWSPIIYKAFLDLNYSADTVSPPDGTNMEMSFDVETSSEMGEPKRVGYNFLGWCTDPDGQGELLQNYKPGTVGNVTLYAIWEPIRYTITCYEVGDCGHNADPALSDRVFTYTIEDAVLPEDLWNWPGYYVSNVYYYNDLIQGDNFTGIPAGEAVDLTLLVVYTGQRVQWLLTDLLCADEKIVVFDYTISNCSECQPASGKGLEFPTTRDDFDYEAYGHERPDEISFTYNYPYWMDLPDQHGNPTLATTTSRSFEAIMAHPDLSDEVLAVLMSGRKVDVVEIGGLIFPESCYGTFTITYSLDYAVNAEGLTEADLIWPDRTSYVKSSNTVECYELDFGNVTFAPGSEANGRVFVGWKFKVVGIREDKEYKPLSETYYTDAEGHEGVAVSGIYGYFHGHIILYPVFVYEEAYN